MAELDGRNSNARGAAGPSLTIDLAALGANWRALAAKAASAECAAVVKADAYGLGIEHVVPALAACGVRTFFVALPDEGRRVREASRDSIIYVLNGFFRDSALLYRQAGLRPVLCSLDQAESWARLSGGAPSALQVDTGMNRLGFPLREALELARRPDLLAAVAPALLLSHLACADEPAHPMNRQQLALFTEIRAEFPRLPASLANSAGIFLGPNYHFDLVRPGIALYGGMGCGDGSGLSSVVTFQAPVIQVRDAGAGETVGYGAALRLTADARIAILAAGYADGYLRAAGSSDSHPGGTANIRGKRVRILGRVSMDLIAIDVTNLPGVTPGDQAELFGPNLPIGEAAAAAGTMAYELLTGLSRRAARRYVPDSNRVS